MRTEFQDKIYDTDSFERWLENPPWKIRKYLEKETAYLIENTPDDSTILDVGCGFGRHIKILGPKAKRIVGIDYNANIIQRVRQELKDLKKVELFVENAKQMPFENNRFDVVICMLNTFGDSAEFKIPILKEMKRVCKPRGKIIITVWSEHSLEERVEAYKRAGWEIEKIEGENITIENSHTSEAFTKEKLLKIFNEAELHPKIIRLEEVAYLAEATK